MEPAAKKSRFEPPNYQDDIEPGILTEQSEHQHNFMSRMQETNLIYRPDHEQVDFVNTNKYEMGANSDHKSELTTSGDEGQWNESELLKEPGSDHELPIKESGSDHELPIKESGSDHELLIKESGSDHELLIKESGSDHELLIKESGSDHELLIKESGSDHELLIKESGSDHELLIKELGSDYELLIEDSGSKSLIDESRSDSQIEESGLRIEEFAIEREPVGNVFDSDQTAQSEISDSKPNNISIFVNVNEEHETELGKLDHKLAHGSTTGTKEVAIQQQSEPLKTTLEQELSCEAEHEQSGTSHERNLELEPSEVNRDHESDPELLENELEVESESQQGDLNQDLGPESEENNFHKEKLKLMRLNWKKEPDAFEWMWYPTAVHSEENIYVGDRLYYRQFLCVFNMANRTWYHLPLYNEYQMRGFSLAATNNHVHCVGGWLRAEGHIEYFSNHVFSLDSDFEWHHMLPPLNIGRRAAASASFENFIVVAGGMGVDGCLSSVEVLNSSQPSSTWWLTCDLPVKSELLQCTVSKSELFIGCGTNAADTIYTAKLSNVKDSQESTEDSAPQENFWKCLPRAPHNLSGLTTVNDCLITVGGNEGKKSCSSIDLYDYSKNRWIKVCDNKKSRCHPAVLACNTEDKQELFVICGYGAPSSMESCELV